MEKLIMEYPEYFIILSMIGTGTISFIILRNLLLIPVSMLLGFFIGMVIYSIYRRK